VTSASTRSRAVAMSISASVTRSNLLSYPSSG